MTDRALPTEPIAGHPPEVMRLHDVDLGAGIRVSLVGLAEPEALLDTIDPEAFRRDERMPYWAELWPSAIGLARFLVGAGRAEVRAQDVLDLGAGLGLTSVAAGLAGARSVLSTDYFAEAVAFAAHNAARAGLEGVVRAAHLDWRTPDLPRRFPVVIGSDLLFERRNVVPLLDAALGLLAPGGALLLADPLRPTAAALAEEADARGLSIEERGREPVGRVTVALYRIRRRG